MTALRGEFNLANGRFEKAERLPWWAYAVMLPVVIPVIVAGGWAIDRILQMGGG